MLISKETNNLIKKSGQSIAIRVSQKIPRQLVGVRGDYEKMLNHVIIRKMKINKQDAIFHSRDGQKLGVITSNDGKDHSQALLVGT